jgi:hypothetical protein
MIKKDPDRFVLLSILIGIDLPHLIMFILINQNISFKAKNNK